MFYGLIAGLISIIGHSLFYFAISKSEISKIIAFDRIKLIIVLLFAIIIFKEPFTLWMILGILLIIIGNYLLSISKNSKKPKLETGIILMLLSGVIGALTIIQNKLGVNIGNPIIIALLASATRSCFFILVSFIFKRSDLKQLFKSIKKIKILIALIIRSFSSATGWVAFYYALSLGYIYQVTGIGQLRPAIVVILSAIFLKEKETLRRLLATIIIIIGALSIVLTNP